MSGDKLCTLQQLAGFAAQHGMIWVPLGQLPGWQDSTGSAADLNRLSAFLGLMAQSNSDEGPGSAPPPSDRRTGELYGRRVAVLTHRWAAGRPDTQSRAAQAWPAETPACWIGQPLLAATGLRSLPWPAHIVPAIPAWKRCTDLVPGQTCDAHRQVWDPFGTLRNTLWIGGGQWSGKSTVARILARRYGLTAYHYDYHDARGHQDRRIARRVRLGEPPSDPDPDETWVDTTPEQMAAGTLAGFPIRFEWVLDDLRGLVSGRPLIGEGWGLRPELIAPITDSPRRMLVMIATEAFRQRQLHELPRAATISDQVRDPARAQCNRLARDRIVAEDAASSAHRLGIRVIEVDGICDAEAIADIVAEHFRPYLSYPAVGED